MSTVPDLRAGAVPVTRRPPVVPLVERFGLRMLVEACLVHEDGGASLRDIEVGMMTGAAIVPGPFARADEQGLDRVLGRLEAAAEQHGDRFEPPVLLRRLVQQGRLGRSTGQGFFAYPKADAERSRETVLVEDRDDVAVIWLNRPPANALSPQLLRELAEVWGQLDGQVRAVVLMSASILTFSAGADVKAFTRMEAEEAAELLDTATGLMRSMERSPTATIAAVNGPAFGGGCELTMACDVRIAASSAQFGQPEVTLGILPGFGGTQRLPRLVGAGLARRMMLVGQPIDAQEALDAGLVDDVVPDLELFDAALTWARKLASQPPIALAEIKRLVRGDLDEGLAAERDAFLRAFGSGDAREGFSAFGDKRAPRFQGR
jgi:enoyl-CoA hydratase/3-hydroxyacyl-CoA dehydrogenase